MRLALLALGWLLGTLVGCAGRNAAPQEMLGEGELVEARASIHANVMAPQRVPAERTFTVVEANSDAQRVIHRFESANEHESEWKRVELHSNEALHAVRTEFWRRGDDGGIIMPAVIDHEENALTLFDPPLPVMYAELSPGKPREFKGRMRVVEPKNERNERERGAATQTMTLAGEQMITINGRRTRVLRVEIEFTADLRLAKAEKSMVLLIDPEHGVVRSQQDEAVSILGFSTSRDQLTIERESLD